MYYKIQKRRQIQTVKQSLNSHNKVHFAYGKHTMSCPQLPNESLTIIDSHINSATGSSQGMSQCYCRMKKIRYTIALPQLKAITNVFPVCIFSVLHSRRRSPTSTRDFAFAIRHKRSLRR